MSLPKTNHVFLAAAAIALAACSSAGPGASPSLLPSSAHFTATKAPAELANLDYANGTITIYHIAGETASAYSHFRPENGAEQGIAVDASGLVYTTVTNGKHCGTCVEVFTPQGKLTNTLVAPKLKGAPGAAALANVSVDDRGNVYVSDSGQQAVYYYSAGSTAASSPHVIVSNVDHLGASNAAPDGQSVVVAGCAFGSARAFRRDASGTFQAGKCFSFPTPSLLGSTSDNVGETLTPIDPQVGNVAVSKPGAQSVFATPNHTTAIVMSVAMGASGAVTYAADVHNEVVYVFSRPTNGWLKGGQPKVIATYKGFEHLNFIAVPQ